MERQASEALAEAKLRSELYNQRFKNAFKEGTNLLSKQITGKDTATSSFSVDKLVADLNQKYNLVKGNKKLSKTTLYRAVLHGKVGENPMKRGPDPKIPDILPDVTSLHAEVSQVGKGGELRGRGIKQMLGAAVLGTMHDDRFSVESAWKKLQTQHLEQLQAGTKVSMEEARSKSTTVNNLEQWFDDVKAGLINSGHVIDRALMSEVDFCPHDVRRPIINMDETHHDLSITGNKGGSRALVYSNPKRQRGYKKTVNAGRHVTGVYASNAAGEALPPLSIFTRVLRLNQTSVSN